MRATRKSIAADPALKMEQREAMTDEIDDRRKALTALQAQTSAVPVGAKPPLQLVETVTTALAGTAAA